MDGRQVCSVLGEASEQSSQATLETITVVEYGVQLPLVVPLLFETGHYHSYLNNGCGRSKQCPNEATNT